MNRTANFQSFKAATVATSLLSCGVATTPGPVNFLIWDVATKPVNLKFQVFLFKIWANDL
jgi:hypothetical protein